MLSIRKKLILLMLIILLISIFLLQISDIIRDIRELKINLREKGVLFSTYNSEKILHYVSQSDTKNLKNFLEKTNSEKNIFNINDITILDSNKKIIYDFDEQLIGQQFKYKKLISIIYSDKTKPKENLYFYDKTDWIRGNIYIIRTYENNDNLSIYDLSAFDNTNNIYIIYKLPYKLNLENISNVILYRLLPTFISLMLGFILTIVLSKKIIEPIIILNKATKEISKGNLDVSLDIDSKDEIGELSRRFDIMAKNLKISFEKIALQNKQIKEYTLHLEEKVDKRTKELSKKNKQLLRELDVARRVQLNLIPKLREFPRKELEFSSMYVSLERLGGDLFDVIRVGKNGYGLLIADATGHGVPAALIATMAKVSFKNHSGWGISPSTVCENVNNEFMNLIGDLNYFLTAYYAVINLETGELQYTSAGHTPAILYRKADKSIEVLDPCLNPPIGAFTSNVKYDSISIQLYEGDRILLYTDGIIEARNGEGEFYGQERLIEYVSKNSELSTDAFVKSLTHNLNTFCGERLPDDDRAILYVEFKSKVEPDVKHIQNKTK